MSAFLGYAFQAGQLSGAIKVAIIQLRADPNPSAQSNQALRTLLDIDRRTAAQDAVRDAAISAQMRSNP